MPRTVVLAWVISIGLVCKVASAGDLRCLVTGEGGLQADVKVTVKPGDAILTTGRDGLCLFTALAVGTYRVTAEKVAAGQLKGAVRDEVSVPGHRQA